MQRLRISTVALLATLLAAAIGTAYSQSPRGSQAPRASQAPIQLPIPEATLPTRQITVTSSTPLVKPAVADWNDAQKWSLERLELRDGRIFEGMIVRELDEAIELDEVRRPPGRSMVLIKRRFPKDTLRKIDRLDDDERRRLADRLDSYRNRSWEESQNMAALVLEKKSAGDTVGWHYRASPWFELESRADEELTRRAIVRIEQMFQAFAVTLPPRKAAVELEKQRGRLKISLFETNHGYREFQTGLGVDLRNPAFYLRDKNVLAAGAELSALVRGLAAVREKNAATKTALTALNAQIPLKLQQAVKDFTAQGRSPDDVKQLVGLMRAGYQKELTVYQDQLAKAERQNTRQFENFTGLMFQRLYHEAFHAYLENFVYPSTTSDVPRWLNEGLAQVFEEGVLEVGTLRLDVPGKRRITELQKDLRDNPRLPLSEVLESTADRFLVSHEQQARDSQRLYLYSWGLAYYLAIREPVLKSQSLDRYVEADAAKLSPVKRFELMVGQPLAEFERTWRKEMAEYDPK